MKFHIRFTNPDGNSIEVVYNTISEVAKVHTSTILLLCRMAKQHGTASYTYSGGVNVTVSYF